MALVVRNGTATLVAIAALGLAFPGSWCGFAALDLSSEAEEAAMPSCHAQAGTAPAEPNPAQPEEPRCESCSACLQVAGPSGSQPAPAASTFAALALVIGLQGVDAATFAAERGGRSPDRAPPDDVLATTSILLL